MSRPAWLFWVVFSLVCLANVGVIFFTLNVNHPERQSFGHALIVGSVALGVVLAFARRTRITGVALLLGVLVSTVGVVIWVLNGLDNLES